MAASSGDNAALLEPGVHIRPQTNTEDVRRLVKKLYSLGNISITEINAYDDKNFHIKVPEGKRPDGYWEHGYVLKIINTLDSTKLSFFEAQDQMMIYIGARGIQCPQPVKNSTGTYYSVEKIYHKADGKDAETYNQHVVRMLTFQPGVILHQIECTAPIFFQAGQYIGHLDNILKGFHHVAYDTHTSLWSLESVPMLRKFLFAVTDEQRRSTVTQILDSYDREVAPLVSTLERGMLHGDFNEQNILARECARAKGGWEIHAVIDFGDTQFSCYVFELAIAICYMMLQAKTDDPLDVGGHVIAGYNRERQLPSEEFSLLKTCVSARFCQSLVMGAYSHLQDPGNEYILTTQAAGWTRLEQLYNTPQRDLEERWQKIISSYKNKKVRKLN